MIIAFESNTKLLPLVTELFIRGRKLNTSLVFISQSYFSKKELQKLGFSSVVFLRGKINFNPPLPPSYFKNK